MGADKYRRGPATPSVEIESKQVLYDGFFRMEQYRLRHRLYEGGMSAPVTRELFERGHAAALLPYDPWRDEVVLVEQFRIGALQVNGGPWLIEVVAGIIEEGEQPQEVARREAEEEAGCSVDRIEHICDCLVSPGGTSEQLSIYCGRVDASRVGGIHGLDSEHEDIRTFTLPFDETWRLFEQGEINSASPIISLQWLKMNRERLRDEWC